MFSKVIYYYRNKANYYFSDYLRNGKIFYYYFYLNSDIILYILQANFITKVILMILKKYH